MPGPRKRKNANSDPSSAHSSKEPTRSSVRIKNISSRNIENVDPVVPEPAKKPTKTAKGKLMVQADDIPAVNLPTEGKGEKEVLSDNGESDVKKVKKKKEKKATPAVEHPQDTEEGFDDKEVAELKDSKKRARPAAGGKLKEVQVKEKKGAPPVHDSEAESEVKEPSEFEPQKRGRQAVGGKSKDAQVKEKKGAPPVQDPEEESGDKETSEIKKRGRQAVGGGKLKDVQVKEKKASPPVQDSEDNEPPELEPKKRGRHAGGAKAKDPQVKGRK